MSTQEQDDTAVQAANDNGNPRKKPRLIKTKIVIGCDVGFWLFVAMDSQPFIYTIVFFPLTLFAGGLSDLMWNLPWLALVVIFLPTFPALFLIFRKSWLQFMGMIYHLAMSVFLFFSAWYCFYYYYHFEEIEQNDNPGILAIFAWFLGCAYVINAVILLAFIVMLYFDYRAMKKYRIFLKSDTAT